MASITTQQINEIATRNGVDPALVHKIIRAESAGNPNAKSPVGAAGLMQLMPPTAKQWGVKNPYDPVQNVEGGTKYLAWLLKRYDGDVNKALMGYNWGPGNLDLYTQGKKTKIPLETRNYIKKITGDNLGEVKIQQNTPPAYMQGGTPDVAEAFAHFGIDPYAPVPVTPNPVKQPNWIAPDTTVAPSMIPFEALPTPREAAPNHSLRSAMRWLNDEEFTYGKPVR